MFLLAETSKQIKIYQINETQKGLKVNKEVTIDLESAFLASSGPVIENSCITLNINYLVLCAHHSLLFIDSSTGKVAFTKDLDGHQINVEYFLSPTNLSTNHLAKLTAIVNSDNVIALSNLKNLVFVEHNNIDDSDSSTRINLFDSDNKRNQFDSFQINFKAQVALALDKTNFELVVFDLNVVARKSSFHAKNSILFKINLSVNNYLEKFGCDPNFEYIYVIERKKILKIFTISIFLDF